MQFCMPSQHFIFHPPPPHHVTHYLSFCLLLCSLSPSHHLHAMFFSSLSLANTLTEPNFVGSFDIGEYVYFFFRETAVEYINCGKAVYSRIARVCKKDTGGKNILNQNWATYLKARLNCSISGEFPFYFNEIQAVYQLPTDKTKFYATFTTSTNGLVGSAVCSFDINEINGAFAGKLYWVIRYGRECRRECFKIECVCVFTCGRVWDLCTAL